AAARNDKDWLMSCRAKRDISRHAFATATRGIATPPAAARNDKDWLMSCRAKRDISRPAPTTAMREIATPPCGGSQ
ncbi:MAG: hypothetical protein AB1457_16810, partial [Chloroflexota bacterium]